MGKQECRSPTVSQKDHITRHVPSNTDTQGLRCDEPDTNTETPPALEERDIEASKEQATADYVHPAPVTIPKSCRRGILGQFTLVAEVEDPKDYPRLTKWYITFVVALAAVAAPMGSAIILPALGQISAELHAEPSVTNIAVALYMLAMSVGPLWWSSFSESMGRRTVYIISFTLFIVWNIIAAVSSNIAMLIVMRLLDQGGGAAASVQAVGAGVILVFLIFALPETLKEIKPTPDEDNEEAASHEPPLTRVSSRQRVQQASKKWTRMLKLWFLDPLSIISYLRFPAVLITVYYASVTFGLLYALNISLQDTFSKAPYSFSTERLGLIYIPNSLGYFLASIFGGRWTDRIMAREAKKSGRCDESGKPMYRPEDRMRENAWIAAILYPAALIWYGWTAEKGVHWAVPLVANFFFGIGSMLVFAMSTTMLTE
ncbi:MAG: hypothetical protein Q9208_008657 [Pyrenodesmia sp. 3 TL-2023]